MTKTTEDCKNYIKSISAQNGFNLNSKWKRLKKYNKGNLILRDFQSSNNEFVTIAEENNTLSLYVINNNANINNSNNINMKSNWKQLLTTHFSAPCYNGQVFSDSEMLDEYMSAIEHGIQHESYEKNEIYFKVENGIKFLITPIGNQKQLIISEDDLNKFGFKIKKNQNAFDFISEHWNFY